jgi:hypothetical protein
VVRHLDGRSQAKNRYDQQRDRQRCADGKAKTRHSASIRGGTVWPAVIRRPRQSESFAIGDQESITARRVQMPKAARQASRGAAIVPEAAALYENAPAGTRRRGSGP